jgi:hypothetical protein
MENKESYTPEEAEEMVVAMSKYIRSCQNYYVISGSFINNIFLRKGIDSARENVDKSIKYCKEKIPKNILARIVLSGSDELDLY